VGVRLGGVEKMGQTEFSGMSSFKGGLCAASSQFTP